MPSPCDGKDPNIFTSRTEFLKWKDAASTGKNTILTGLERTTTPTTAQTSALSTLLSDVISVNACFEEKISAVRTQPSDIATKQLRLLALEDELKQKEDAVQIGKDRLSYIKDPEHKVNFYDSWFPLHRPLRPQTVPILIALATFFGLVAFGYLFGLAGIRLLVQLPEATGSTGVSRMFSQLTPAFWLLFVVSVSAIFSIIYR